MGSRRAKLERRVDVRFVWTDLFFLLRLIVDGCTEAVAHGVHGHTCSGLIQERSSSNRPARF